MKRIGIVIMLSAALLTSFALAGCKEKEKYVKIDDKTFPGYSLLSAAKRADLDGDNKLSQSEIESATSIVLYMPKDLTGLEAFTNLETITIKDGENMQYEFKHFTNLRNLRIDGAWGSARIDLSANTKLETIYIDSNDLQELVLPEGAPLKKFTLCSSKLKGIDLNSYKGLDYISFETNDYLTELVFRDFPELTKLNCTTNKVLSTLNVSNCPKLKDFDCSENALADLNCSGCGNIETFWCYKNYNLTSLDLCAFPKLTELWCANNKFTELDLSPCPELTKLICVECGLTSLDLSSTPKLKVLMCGGNPLNELDVTCCPDIESVSCWDCDLTRVNVTGCSNLHNLICMENKLSSLDLTGCTNLSGLDCYKNDLTSVDISMCPKLIDLLNTNGFQVSKEGYLVCRDKDGKAAIEFDEKTEFIK